MPKKKAQSVTPQPTRTFQTDGTGRWWVRTHAVQCPFGVGDDFLTLFFGGRCQGEAGHTGWHWRYSDCGSLQTYENEKELTSRSKYRTCSSMCPPDHKTYESPRKRYKLYYGSCGSKWTRVKDHALIERLNQYDPYDPNCDHLADLGHPSIIRPMPDSALTPEVKRRRRGMRAQHRREEQKGTS